MWKEAVEIECDVLSRYLTGECDEILTETSVETAPFRADFRTQASPRTKLECYSLGL